MNRTLRYSYFPVFLGGTWRSVWLALRLYIRYGMVSCFFSEKPLTVWHLFRWLSCESLPLGCPGSIAVSALSYLADKSPAYTPFLVLSPTWEKKLTASERREIESRYVLSPPDTADFFRYFSNVYPTSPNHLTRKGFL